MARALGLSAANEVSSQWAAVLSISTTLILVQGSAEWISQDRVSFSTGPDETWALLLDEMGALPLQMY